MVHGGGCPGFHDPNAKWIWNTPYGASWATTNIRVPFFYKYITNGELDIVVNCIADNTANIYINGSLIGEANGGWGGAGFFLNGKFKKGGNYIVIDAMNWGNDPNPAGILATVYNKDTNQTLFSTNQSWAIYNPMNSNENMNLGSISSSQYLMADNGGALETDYFWCPSKNTNIAVTYPGGYQAINKGTSNANQRFRFKKCKPGRNPLGGADSWVSTGASDEERVIRSGDIIAIYSPHNNRVYDCAWGPESPCTQQPFPPPGGNWGTPMKIFIESGSVGEKINITFTVYFTRMWYGKWDESKSLVCDNSQCKGANVYNKYAFKFVPVQVN